MNKNNMTVEEYTKMKKEEKEKAKLEKVQEKVDDDGVEVEHSAVEVGDHGLPGDEAQMKPSDGGEVDDAAKMKLSAIENDFGNALDDIDITEDHVSRGQVQKEPDEEVTLIDGDGALESLLEGVGGVKEDLRTDEEQRGDEEEERGKDMSDHGDAEKRLDDRADVRDEEDKSRTTGGHLQC
eukprot:Selendium_serpulae@DN5856_c0_g1_i2.p1